MSNRNLPNLFGRRSTPSSSIKQQRQHAQPFDMESKIDSDNEETVIIDRSPEHRPVTQTHTITPLTDAVEQHQAIQNDQADMLQESKTVKTTGVTDTGNDVNTNVYNNNNIEPVVINVDDNAPSTVSTPNSSNSNSSYSSWFSRIFSSNKSVNSSNKSKPWLLLGLGAVALLGIGLIGYYVFSQPQSAAGIVYKSTPLTQHARFRQ